ncbi:hypothetical protein BDZ91DRAFT_782539 [Kalaharituber pfeilii]|nr:hypothetical protein BDZ91DRAFT_782539 [Kalaharituber pfeilii]
MATPAAMSTPIAPPPPAARSVAIIGAGVAGLRAAQALLSTATAPSSSSSNPPLHIHLIEARPRLGGRAVTSGTPFAFSTCGSSSSGNTPSAWTGPGRSVDLGPNWVHGTAESPLMGLAGEDGEIVLADPFAKRGGSSMVTNGGNGSTGAGFGNGNGGGGMVQIVCGDDGIDPKAVGEEVEMLGSGRDGVKGRLVKRDIGGEVFDEVMSAVMGAEGYSKEFYGVGRPNGSVEVEEEEEIDERWSLWDYARVVVGVRFGIDIDVDLGPEVPSHVTKDEKWERERRRIEKWERARFARDRRLGNTTQNGIRSPERAKMFMRMLEFWGGWIGEDVRRQSLRCFLMEEGMEGENLLVASTYGPIVENMAGPIYEAVKQGRLTLSLNTKVTAVRITSCELGSRPTVEVTMVSTVDGDNGGLKTNTYTAAILAVPLGVLKRSFPAPHASTFPTSTSAPLTIHPPLPLRAINAIRSLGYGRLEKIYLRFSAPFWASIKANVISFLRADHPSLPPAPGNVPRQGQLLMFSFAGLPSGCAQNGILVYLFGEASEGLVRAVREAEARQKRSSSSGVYGAPKALEPGDGGYEVVEGFLEPYLQLLWELAQAEATSVLDINAGNRTGAGKRRPRPTHVLTTSWCEDALSGWGSYTNFPVGLTEGIEDVEALVGVGGGDYPLWLAGEYASPLKALGTVAGAWWSGEGAAEEVMRWFGSGGGGRGTGSGVRKVR